MSEVPLQDRLCHIFDDAGGSDTLVDLLAEFDFESSRELAETIVAAMSGVATLQARGDRLAGYAGHDDDCDAVQTPWSDPGPCTCGYTEALTEWRKGC